MTCEPLKIKIPDITEKERFDIFSDIKQDLENSLSNPIEHYEVLQWLELRQNDWL